MRRWPQPIRSGGRDRSALICCAGNRAFRSVGSALILLSHIQLLIVFIFWAGFSNTFIIGDLGWFGINMVRRFITWMIVIEPSTHRTYEGRNVVWQRLDVFKEVGVHFCPQHENDGKVVKEDQEYDGKTYLT